MRIALLHPFPWPEVRRGAERYLADLSWFLAGAGHDVDVITGTSGRSTTSVEDGVRVHRRHLHGRHRLHRFDISPSDAFGAHALPTLLRRRYDVVHTLVPSGVIAAKLTAQRCLYTLLGHPTPEQVGIRRVDEPVLRTALRRADAVAVLSTATADSIRFLTTRPVEVVPPGLRSDRFPVDLTPRRGPLRVLFSAHGSDARKGGAVLVEAFARVLQVHPDARLQHSGEGSLDHALGTLPTEERLLVDGALDRLGPGAPDDVPARYRAATVTVLPARHEAFGLVLVESLASGTPVVCVDDGGPPEIVTDPGVGRVVPPDDAAALAAAIVDVAALAGDPATPGRCAEHARSWDWATSIGPRHVAVYRDLVERRHP